MEPVLVVLVQPSHECVHCEALMKIWPKVTQSLLTVYPKLKFPIPIHETKKYKYPPILIKNNQVAPIYPHDLNNYCGKDGWSPMVLLIPGESWQKAIKDPKANIKLENVQIMNSKLDNNILVPFNKWKTKDPKNFGLWLKEVLPKLHPIQFFPSILEKINVDTTKGGSGITDTNAIITDILKRGGKTDVCQHVLNIVSR